MLVEFTNGHNRMAGKHSSPILIVLNVSQMMMSLIGICVDHKLALASRPFFFITVGNLSRLQHLHCAECEGGVEIAHRLEI